MSHPGQTVLMWYVVSLVLWRLIAWIKIYYFNILILVSLRTLFVLLSAVRECHLVDPDQKAVFEVRRDPGRRDL